MGLPAKNRLKKDKDFKEVYKKGDAVNGNFLFIKVRASADKKFRIGLVIPAKIYPKATDRNRIKRILKEDLRTKKEKFINKFYIVVVIKKKSDEENFKKELMELLARKGLIV